MGVMVCESVPRFRCEGSGDCAKFGLGEKLKSCFNLGVRVPGGGMMASDSTVTLEVPLKDFLFALSGVQRRKSVRCPPVGSTVGSEIVLKCKVGRRGPSSGLKVVSWSCDKCFSPSAIRPFFLRLARHQVTATRRIMPMMMPGTKPAANELPEKAALDVAIAPDIGNMAVSATDVDDASAEEVW